MNRRRLLTGTGALVLAAAGGGYVSARDMGSMDEYNAAVAAGRAALKQAPEMNDFIRYATLAPSGHNTQPWIFRAGQARVDILPDLSRRTPVVDPDDHHLFVGLGCSAETLGIAAAASQRPVEIAFDPANDGAVRIMLGAGASADRDLCDAIPHRQSTRSLYDGKSVSARDLQLLVRTAAMPGVDLVLLTDRTRIERVRDLVVAGNSTQMASDDFLRELKHWLRFNPREALATGDGLFSVLGGNPALPTWLGPRVFDWAFTTKSENDKYARQIDSSAGIAVFVAHEADKAHWVLVGRACQRFALQATALGIRHCFVNQPVEVPGLRPELAKLVGLPGRRPDLVMRFGFGATLPYSARRPPGSSTIA
jgi:nitroreductase